MSVPTHAHPLALDMLLAESAALHRHLCPRQVIGVRMGLLAARLLDLALPQEDKRLLTIVESDGCFCDGVSVATGCWVGRRTLRVVDYGKVAATVIDTQGERAWRIAPHPDARAGAATYAPAARNNWQAMLEGYQQMPDDELFTWQAVTLTQSLAEILSKPGCRAVCARCGEEILNERELLVGGEILCRACAEGGYWRAG
jgi:formylmethanofuran dehydrogenase subunit E